MKNICSATNIPFLLKINILKFSIHKERPVGSEADASAATGI